MKLNIYSFLEENDKLSLEKYNKFGKKLKIVSKSYLIVNLYTIKNIYKLKFYNRKINSNFYNNKMPKKGSKFISYK